MWKKVLYFGVAVIIGIVVALLGYSSNQYNHIYGLTSEAISEKNYSEVAKIFGGCFDTKSIITEDSEDVDVVVYPGSSLTNVSYGDKKTFLAYEEAYYVYIFSPKFSYLTATNGDTMSNKTSLRFTSGTKNYDYPFIVSSTVNSSTYKEKPETALEAVLNASRDVTATQSNWGFMTVTVTKTMLDEFTRVNGSPITSMSILNNIGENVFTTDIDLTFSQSFFADIDELFVNYNIYLQAYLADNNNKEAVTTFNAFYEEWYKDFEASTATTGYTFRYDDSYLSPGKLIWQTVGMLALFLVMIILFYILLFHFAAIKRLFNRESYKDYSNNKGGKSTSNQKPIAYKKGALVEEEVIKAASSKESQGSSEEKVVDAEIEEIEPTNEEKK